MLCRNYPSSSLYIRITFLQKIFSISLSVNPFFLNTSSSFVISTGDAISSSPSYHQSLNQVLKPLFPPYHGYILHVPQYPPLCSQPSLRLSSRAGNMHNNSARSHRLFPRSLSEVHHSGFSDDCTNVSRWNGSLQKASL